MKQRNFSLNTRTIAQMYLLFSLNYVCKAVSIALPRLGSDSYVFATANKLSHRRYLAFPPNSQDVIRFGSIGVFFQTTILIDIITRKMRLFAVSNSRIQPNRLAGFRNAPRRNRISRKGVDLLTNMDRITTTMTIADLHHENILIMDTIDKQNS